VDAPPTLGVTFHSVESGDDLASQPTISRWENAPDLRTLLRLGYAMIDLWCRSHRRPPKSITLDIDDTVDVVHGHQPLSLFNAHYDERCFLPIHVYDADGGHCVAVLLRPGKTPSGREIRGHLRRLIRHPPALAAHPDHHPWGQPLRAAGGDGLVRCQRCRRHPGPVRQFGVGGPGRGCRRRCAH
jgi:hypothetical protein